MRRVISPHGFTLTSFAGTIPQLISGAQPVGLGQSLNPAVNMNPIRHNTKRVLTVATTVRGIPASFATAMKEISAIPGV
jgi:hypothetical protein